MKTVADSKVQGTNATIAHLSLTSALGVGGWTASRPGRFTPGKDPGTHFIRGWVGPRCGKSRHHRDSIPGPSSPYQVAKRLSYRGLH